MVRFFILWSVFSFKNSAGWLDDVKRDFSQGRLLLLRKMVRYLPLPVLLTVAKRCCALRLLGRPFRLRDAVANENTRCLIGQKGRVDAAWVAVRRRLLEEAATW